jgi:GNAT superfamily N-acetyltransferase
MKLVFEPLASAHDRTGFSCGVPALDRWFRQQAGQEERRNVARVFVARDPDAGGSDAIVGFYTLSMFTLALGDLPSNLGRRLPRHPDVPAVLIGRLARAAHVRGKAVGELLLADALERALRASRSAAASAVVVDAKDESAASFYQSFGFVPFPTDPRRLFILLETARGAVSRTEP